ncbi:SOUL family heme-binding protein [Alteromonas sp. H39]|uniref:SOUL family heme-binding protein n=1 Tax=Alteromonas sp. H39 TaxID=3389876 RepID=UPI0039E0D10C
MRLLAAVLGSVFLSGCSVFGANGVESAPYTVIEEDEDNSIEVRQYDPMILVSASMDERSENSAFRKLFRYISGNNRGDTEIAMTAPVFMDENTQGKEIAMTAPVFMAENTREPSMSFVMPADFTLETTPQPKDESLTVSEVKNFKAAAIRFSGLLSDSNVAENTAILREWLESSGYQAVGEPIKAGYDGPMTLPFLRHNEVLIQVE